MTDQRPSQERQEVRDEESATTQQTTRGTRRVTRSQQRGSQRSPRPAERQFLFIDASTDRSASGEAVRVHVMREAHRTRRERQGIQAQPRRRRTVVQDEMVMFDSRNPSQSASASVSEATTPQPQFDTAGPNPGVGLAAAAGSNIDWPSITRIGSSASSASIDTLHALAEDISTVQPLQPEILDLCRGDTLSMSSYLALATYQLATNEQESANIASAQFEARTLEILRERITHTTPMHTDTTIMAVLLLSKLERKGNANSALFHWNALGRLIRDRGGMVVLRGENAELYDVLLAFGVSE